MSAGLRSRLVVRRPGFVLDLDLAAQPGTVTALLGPNGAGKSTALRALAGLLPLDDGSIALGGRALHGLPPEQRAVGVVFQDYLLFPHLDVLANVAFGLRARGARRREAEARARAELERVGLADLAHARPARLSGGQQQRVALARALAPDPALLLLDEPLAALDAATRLEVRSDLRARLTGYPGCTVLVTHDPLDALVLADRLVVLEGGRVVQQGTPAEVARAPRTDYVAQLVGLNLHRGRAEHGVVQLDSGGVLAASGAPEGPVLLAFAPSAVALHPSRPDGSPRNAWPVRVAGLEQHADVVRVRLDGAPPVLADVTAAAVAALRLVVGQELWAAVKATEVRAYPA